MIKYLAVFFLSMVPILELRFAVPFAVGMGLPYIPALITCVIGNMVPVPFIYLFARKFLVWGSNKKYIHKICKFFRSYRKYFIAEKSRAETFRTVNKSSESHADTFSARSDRSCRFIKIFFNKRFEVSVDIHEDDILFHIS